MPKPPIDPDSFDKVNFVIDAWTTGCDAPWYIYIETMKPALLNAFITLITFGFDDVLRGYFRPKGLYKRRSGKRKGKFVRRIPRFPELGNTLGKHLPYAEHIRGTKWSTLGKTLWRIDGVMEQVRFFWLVAAITEDFAFEWTSLLYESYWCQPDPPGRFSYRVDGLTTRSGGSWHPASFPHEDYEETPPTWFTSTGNSGPTGCTAAAALKFEKHPAFPAPTATAVRIINFTTGDVLAETETDDIAPDGSSSVPVKGDIPPNTIFRVQFWHNAFWASVGAGFVVGVGAD